MSRIEIEDLLWELSRLDEADHKAKPLDGAILDSLLAAYRDGRLSADQARQVEDLLGCNLEARRRLESLSGTAPPQISARARQRFLRSAPPRLGPVVGAPARGLGGLPRWMLAAAAILLTFTGGLYFVLRGPSVAPAPLPDIEVRIEGLADIRGEDHARSSTSTTAEPDTAVTVGVIVDPPRAGLVVGLYSYRPQTNTVVRLPLQPTWETRSRALFRAPAESLVGKRPGTYQLFAVIGREGSMPPSRILGSGEGPEAAFHGLDLKVEPLQLEIIQTAAPNLARDSGDQETTGS